MASRLLYLMLAVCWATVPYLGSRETYEGSHESDVLEQRGNSMYWLRSPSQRRCTVDARATSAVSLRYRATAIREEPENVPQLLSVSSWH
jgi:hypothetical protein